MLMILQSINHIGPYNSLILTSDDDTNAFFVMAFNFTCRLQFHIHFVSVVTSVYSESECTLNIFNYCVTFDCMLAS